MLVVAHLAKFALRAFLGGWLVAGFLLADAVLSASAIAESDSARHTRIKLQVAYIYQLTKFVQWPEASFESADAPFRICVSSGSDPNPYFAPLARRATGTHPIRIVEDPSHTDLPRCQILVIQERNSASIAALLARVADRPVLTVSDHKSFIQHKGMIGFVLVDDRVRIDINLQAVKRAGLGVSAKLLEVANLIYEERDLPAHE